MTCELALPGEVAKPSHGQDNRAMTDRASPDATPKPRRRWLQFSLRTLLLLMVPVACVAFPENNPLRTGKGTV